jgi:branched-chain amino acid transport system ATP-binding protein
MPSMLSLEGVRVAIQGADVLRGVSLSVPRGGLVALVGRNGAGKTTTLRAVMGLLPLAEGRISMDGVDLAQVPAFQRSRLGIGYVPEDRRLIGRLTVADNLLLPAWVGGVTDPPQRLEYLYRLMPDLRAFVGQRAAQLSGGQQKMVALARALMSASKLLLLDEPFEGLSPGLGAKLAATIREVQRIGLSVLVAESDLKRVSFVEETYKIERGQIVEEVSVRTGDGNAPSS